jgi:glutathione S-transferase
VPSLSFDGEIFTESGPISWLLADAFPSGDLVLPSSAPGGPQQRARVAFFVDAYFTKFQSHLHKLFAAKTEQESDPIVTAAVDSLVRELEPLLKNANPFFGGSAKITLAEVLTGSFVIRLVSLSKAGVYPGKLAGSIEERAPHFWKWAQRVAADPSVAGIFDEEKIVASTKARIAKARASV